MGEGSRKEAFYLLERNSVSSYSWTGFFIKRLLTFLYIHKYQNIKKNFTSV